MRDDDYVFFPELKDTGQRERIMDVTMIQLLKQANFPAEYIYAWHHCGFFHPDIVNNFRKMMGEPPISSQLSKSEVKAGTEIIAISHFPNFTYNWGRITIAFA